VGVSTPTGIELRLDHLRDLNNLESRLQQFLGRWRFPAVIATCRRVAAGGQFQGSIEDQIAVLVSAVRAGCSWVDIEAGSLERNATARLHALHPAKVIVSYHNYRHTPPLGPIYRRLARLPAQVIKLVGYARNLQDNLKVHQLLKTYGHRRPPLVAFTQGPCGISSRLLALRWGCPFTYAAPPNHRPVAAGQIPLDVLRSVYRIEQLNHRTQIYSVVGTHASMSLSPTMQNVAFQAKHFNAVYLPCETARLADFLALARALGFMGFSITMPFKRAIPRELDWVDPLAAHIGACNTVAVRGGQWMGWNTDAAAVVEVLTKRLRLPGSQILILGAGGAARAAACALAAEGAKVFIAARREPAARQLARRISAVAVAWDRADGLEVDAVINATPVGMAPQADYVPIDLARLRVRVVFDMVYYPMETRLLSEARGRGLITISGVEMLVAQGARQFEIWTGESAPRALMEQAVRQTLTVAPSAA
jgi:3-dehydroquinate dehydratase/shikimate dehydrogenase